MCSTRPENSAPARCNRARVDLDPLDAEDISLLQELIRRHQALTGSARAQQILDNWDSLLPKFVKVFPHEYKRVLRCEREAGTEREAGCPWVK